MEELRASSGNGLADLCLQDDHDPTRGHEREVVEPTPDDSVYILILTTIGAARRQPGVKREMPVTDDVLKDFSLFFLGGLKQRMG